ncbi:mannose-1-phosphate guanylyltransferase/mannose-6-phosphate isomerase [Anderseniella sp. Alg231-50]|uniref:mannose-1-phosphate guanylyltransferase/mannose-6-phosphate isomerase n=1 Tax=Anderseniella sp. Alg231-50 TaxID=1922226 RepID=UPI000D55385C
MNTKPYLVPVVLCGGAGTRLWPLSRQAFPKQFAVEVERKSLLDLTLARINGLDGVASCLAVTGEDYRFMVAEALHNAGVPGSILLEPMARNTAPALCAAALQIAQTTPDAVMVILPSDHFVSDAGKFAAAISDAAKLAQEDWWVTLGIRPTKTSSAYGYIEPGPVIADHGSAARVSQFLEKPDVKKAEELIRAGCVWNAGIFVVKAGTAADLVAKHAPDIHDAVQQAVAGITVDNEFHRLQPEAFSSSPSISIDYAVLEKEPEVAVVPYDGDWSDLGSWDAVAGVHEADDDGNRSEGDAWFSSSQNCFVHSPGKLAVVLGLQDIVVVDTPDALLVTSREQVEQVKTVVDDLRTAERSELTDHRKVARPWGTFEGIDRGDRYQVKRITVKPGAQLSLQYHHHRAEHWIVVKGVAKVTRGDETFLLRENESTYIPLGAVHRLENPGKTTLELIEVQSGSYLGEDDIVRVEDVYGREAEPGSAKPASSAAKPQGKSKPAQTSAGKGGQK